MSVSGWSRAVEKLLRILESSGVSNNEKREQLQNICLLSNYLKCSPSKGLIAVRIEWERIVVAYTIKRMP